MKKRLEFIEDRSKTKLNSDNDRVPDEGRRSEMTETSRDAVVKEDTRIPEPQKRARRAAVGMGVWKRAGLSLLCSEGNSNFPVSDVPYTPKEKVPARREVRPPQQSQSNKRKRPSHEAPSKQKEGWIDLGRGSEIAYFPEHVNKSSHDHAFKVLKAEVEWIQKEVMIMGRPVMQPRMICYMADDPSLNYKYSGAQMDVKDWHPEVLKLKKEVERLSEATFNSCLLNMYRDGKDSVSWHADDEKAYGPRPVITSLSLGEPRDFLLRNTRDHGDSMEFELGPGDIFVMRGNVQRDWQHSIPKRFHCEHTRISLTFREVVNT